AVATFKDTTGGVVGSIPSIACWNSIGVSVALRAIDNPSGSGVQQMAYSATGAQLLPNTTLDVAQTTLDITKTGTTTLTYAAQDIAGNVESRQSLSILVGILD